MDKVERVQERWATDRTGIVLWVGTSVWLASGHHFPGVVMSIDLVITRIGQGIRVAFPQAPWLDGLYYSYQLDRVQGF